MIMKRLVIKIGTNTLTTPNGKPDLNCLRNIVDDISQLIHSKDYECIIVSSGAITCGSTILQARPQSIPEKQGAAAIGQIILMQEFSSFFLPHNLHIGQLLLTKDGLDDSHRNILAKQTIEHLLANGCIPIINENDSVATDEIQYGDNDMLSSKVAQSINADMLILLTDVDGLYSAPPGQSKDSSLINTVHTIDDTILSIAHDSSSENSKGGMKSKITAIQAALDHGINCVIANGKKKNILVDILNETAECSRFFSHQASVEKSESK